MQQLIIILHSVEFLTFPRKLTFLCICFILYDKLTEQIKKDIELAEVRKSRKGVINFINYYYD